MTADSSALHDLDKDVEDARRVMQRWAPYSDQDEEYDRDLSAFESSIVRREAGKVEALQRRLEDLAIAAVNITEEDGATDER